MPIEFAPTSLKQRLTAALLAGASLVCSAQTLPPEVEAALARAKVPREALAALVVDAAPALNSKNTPLLSHRANASVNPASVMKLVTTYAGLELLGPAYTWPTLVYVDGMSKGSQLIGNDGLDPEGPIHLGTGGGAATDSHFSGALDDFRIYGSPLSPYDLTTIRFPDQQARYIRITQTGTSSKYNWSIYELDVY